MKHSSVTRNPKQKNPQKFMRINLKTALRAGTASKHCRQVLGVFDLCLGTLKNIPMVTFYLAISTPPVAPMLVSRGQINHKHWQNSPSAFLISPYIANCPAVRVPTMNLGLGLRLVDCWTMCKIRVTYQPSPNTSVATAKSKFSCNLDETAGGTLSW